MIGICHNTTHIVDDEEEAVAQEVQVNEKEEAAAQLKFKQTKKVWMNKFDSTQLLLNLLLPFPLSAVPMQQITLLLF